MDKDFPYRVRISMDLFEADELARFLLMLMDISSHGYRKFRIWKFKAEAKKLSYF